MWKLFGTIATLITLAAGCVHTGDTPGVQAGGNAEDAVAKQRARDAGRAAGAGGSHAPGSTGLGAGTMGVESNARIGTAR